MSTLVIVESPAKCGKIESFLGSGYKCIASFGHIQELAGLKSIDIDNHFSPSFQPIESKLNQLSKIRKAVAQSKEILLASDDDREGEAIAWHICKVFDLPIESTKRIIFHEITESAVLNAVQNPTTVNMNVVHAQQSRQILDLLVGFKLSPILWKHISRKSKTGLSAGRCQTPALRLVYDNQKAIDDSPGRKVYNTTGYFTKFNISFGLNFHYENEDEVIAFLEETVNHDHIFSCSEPRKVTKNPPIPFTTSRIQQIANNEMHISPKETMSLCQKLYEAGYITYMRTDSTNYSQEFVTTAKTFIHKEWGDKYIHEDIDRLTRSAAAAAATTADIKKSTKKKSGKEAKENTNAQEAHEAIRPTLITRKKIDMSPKEQKMYHLIWRNTCESCMCPAIYSAITAKITAPNQHEYSYIAEQVDFPGWKIVAGYEKENPHYHFLRTIKKGSILPYNKIISKVSLHDLKTHYTESKLVQLLEQKGIGRPSTFSSLIDKIQERGYVKRENVKGKELTCVDFELEDCQITETESKREFGNERNKLVIQPLGVLVLEFLITHFDDLFQYEYTKHMEDDLDLIAKGNKIWYSLCGECLETIDKHIKIISKDAPERKVITIDEYHTYMIAQYGPVIKCIIDGKTSFKPVKKDIDIHKLEGGEYQLEEILEDPSTFAARSLGEYQEEEMFLKNGKFGLYVVWGDSKKSLQYIGKEQSEITLEDAIEFIKRAPGIGRILGEYDDETMFLKKGRYGLYVEWGTGSKKKTKSIQYLKKPEKDITLDDVLSYMTRPNQSQPRAKPAYKKWMKKN